MAVTGKRKAIALPTEQKKKHPKTEQLKPVLIKQWETLRSHTLTADERRTQMGKMMELLRGHIHEITLKHDTSRVIQTCLKHGTMEERGEIAKELSGHYVELSKSVYGRHIVIRLLKYHPPSRREIIGSFKGSVAKLLKHKEAAMVIEELFAVYANSAERQMMVAELYGAEFTLFNEHKRGLEGLEPVKRDAVLRSLGSTLLVLLEKQPQLSIVHRALLDYLMASAAPEEVTVRARELVAEILHTREGSRAAMLLFLRGGAKDRKQMLKTIKPYLKRISQEEHGHSVLLVALDCTDDTVLLGKTLGELWDTPGELVSDQYARRIPLYMLAGRNPQYVGQDALEMMRMGDTWGASKKDPAKRQSELSGIVEQAMAKWLEEAPASVFEPFPSQVACETLLRARAISNAWAQMLELVRKEVDAGHVLVDKVANRVITSCIMAEHNARVPFGSDVLGVLEQSGQLVDAACWGAFPVRALLESQATGGRTKELLAPHCKRIREAMNAAETGKRNFEAILSHLSK
ncbi:Pumilio y domain member 6 [Coemansia spiralis]|uniref:Pumilio y domain member 6 n=2 Tax=Coemansia TaxID=4863 RepID=A0A9W8G516_9FUNG|nr:armadillo-type protein [Coemansia spiralis]KAJ1987878.1 Pumilio y domain member 6 [Coemansia umbellata]KAJ2620488.1 Pumilio y domain member 6 [Coemansia sp. RSA 1358]KAJ2675017.1 Pumilio y domain member 6 [Coemansia spiralis]